MLTEIWHRSCHMQVPDDLYILLERPEICLFGLFFNDNNLTRRSNIQDKKNDETVSREMKHKLSRDLVRCRGSCVTPAGGSMSHWKPSLFRHGSGKKNCLIPYGPRFCVDELSSPTVFPTNRMRDLVPDQIKSCMITVTTTRKIFWLVSWYICTSFFWICRHCS